ncbi:MAG: hypothetical protein JNK99_17060 [Candidatus Accumulibacter sp.]|uniref:hypothetical protein n=1 Tax=Accumulibacter sp. TaxID=2053492 RepID=UPI001A46DE4A|nr:hypothetical protein [Accumulibacter sp.]MBL8396426.1 hypothetical protein [Accumulibacter sp.]
MAQPACPTGFKELAVKRIKEGQNVGTEGKLNGAGGRVVTTDSRTGSQGRIRRYW